MAVRLSAHTVDINAGTLDGVTIGGSVKGAVSTSALIADTADINGGTIDNVIIGGSTPLAGSFTTLSASSGLDSTIIGANTAAAGSFTTGSFSGDTTLKDVTVGVDGTYGGVYRTMGFSGNANGSTRIFATTDDSDALHLAAGTGRGVKIWVNGTSATAFEVDASGNVGIGGTPTQKLTLDGGGTSVYMSINDAFNGDGALFGVDSNVGLGIYSLDSAGTANRPLRFAGGANEYGRFDVSGNLLVGTTSVGGAGGVSLRNDGVIIAPQVYATVVSTSLRDLQMDSSGFMGYSTSTEATKGNITALDDVSWLLSLNPVSFQRKQFDRETESYLDELEQDIEYGLIAEQAETVNPALCFYDETPEGPELAGISYSKLMTPLLKLVQEQQAIIDALTARIEALEA